MKKVSDLILYGVIGICSAVTGLATFICSNRSAEKAAVRRIDELVGLTASEDNQDKDEEDKDED